MLEMNAQCPYNANKLLDQIFKWPWDVSMPRKWSFSLHDYESRGIPVTGDISLDNDAMESWINTQRTIADLATMYDEGKEFIIRDTKQVQMIFDIILEYTSFVAWKFNNTLDLTYGRAPDDPKVAEVLNDVSKLQNLGNKIFPIVVDKMEIQPETEGLLGFIAQQERQYGYFTKPLDFDPFAKYGISRDKFMEHYNAKEDTSNIIDVKQVLDVSSLERLSNHI